MTLNIFCDGGARGNPGPAAIGFVIKDPAGTVIHQHGASIGIATNNVAEYRAVIAAFEWIIQKLDARRYQLDAVNFYLDSALVVNQLNGFFKVKNAHLRQLIVQIKILESQFSVPITYTSVPRTQNFQADALVNQALDSAGF